MTVTIKKKKLVINKLTTQQYADALENNLINENEFYMTPDSPTVSDVKIGDSSVVSDGIAVLGSMASQNTSSYYNKTELDGKLSGAMHFKGTKATFSDLPSSGQEVGDMYNVTETGANYAWDGSNWDKLSENIDLSGVQPNLTSANAGTGISITGSGPNVVISNTQTSAEWGNITGTLSNQTDLQNVLNGKQATLVSGTNIKTVNGKSILGTGDINTTELPDQTGQSGKFLTTNGTNASWELFDDSNLVHKTGTETITGVKTFSDSVSFLGDGDAHCIYIGKNTPINVSGTNQTVLGMIDSRPTLGNTAYSLQLRGSATRPSYNNSDVALLSDVSKKQDTLVSGTNIKTINNTSLLGSGNISITEPSIATTSTAGIVKPDGTSIVVADDGTISTQLSVLSTKVVVDSYTATNNQTIFQLSKKCDNKDYLSVNVSNTELTSSSYELANDGMSVTLLNGVAEGALVDIRYFSNIYLGDEGATFTPSVSKTNYTTTLSWSNNRNLPNPSNVKIYDGVIWTPTQTKSGRTATITWNNNQGKTNPDSINLYDGVTFKPNVTTDSANQTVTLSWTNDGNLPNPQSVTMYLGNDNTTQRYVDRFVATANQTKFVASKDIESINVLSVNIENTELLQSSFSIGSDKRTVTIIDPVEEGAIVELKYFHNLIMAQDGTTFTPQVTATTGGYNLSWTNDQGKTNPSTVFINSIYAVGAWSSSNTYKIGNLVTYEDSNYYYGYIAKQNVPAGAALTNSNYWTLAYTTAKQYVAATIVDWGE